MSSLMQSTRQGQSAKQTKLSSLILEWTHNPAKFVTDAFGVEPDKWQAEALTAQAVFDRTAVRSGHGVGKSAWLSWLILWFQTCYYPAKIACTAPTAHQLEDILWAELAMWHRKMTPSLRKFFAIKHLRCELVGAEAESFAVGRTGRKEQPEALQGFHSENMLFIVDEASGIDEVVFEVAQGALSTPGAKIAMASNPTRTSGYFYDAFHRNRHLWKGMHVSCFDSALVSQHYLDESKANWGADSNVYAVRVLGEFPTEDADSVIPLYLVESALERDVEPLRNMMPVWGLDVARFGTCKTALCKRWGNTQTEMKTWSKRDTMEVAGLVMQEYEDAESDQRPAVINVDSIGVGAGVVDRLHELGLPVSGINVGESPSGKERFTNLRAELWWRVRNWLEERDTKLTSTELGAELTVVKYRVTSNGKIQIERKEEMMDRGVASPDMADAMCLTFAGADRRKTAHDRYTRKQKTTSSGWAA